MTPVIVPYEWLTEVYGSILVIQLAATVYLLSVILKISILVGNGIASLFRRWQERRIRKLMRLK